MHSPFRRGWSSKRQCEVRGATALRKSDSQRTAEQPDSNRSTLRGSGSNNGRHGLDLAGFASETFHGRHVTSASHIPQTKRNKGDRPTGPANVQS
jgi:hypothetical protein